MTNNYIVASVCTGVCALVTSACGPSIELTSSAFASNGAIPAKYTCQGADISPPLAWTNVPDDTVSLALIVDDPDAPETTWVHWVVYNMPSSASGLDEDVDLPSDAREGRNSWDRTGYGGPCPPAGEHRYFHKLYALDTELSAMENATKADLEESMEGHILARGELVGTYEKD